MIHEPAYYAVIPAPVRYDKTLPPAAKLLYGEVSALCTTKGYCWAGNAYFAQLYDVSTDSVSLWLSKLQKAGHVRIDLGKERGFERRIYLSENTQIGILKNSDTLSEILQIAPLKNSDTLSEKNGIAIRKNSEQSITVSNTVSLSPENAGENENFAPQNPPAERPPTPPSSAPPPLPPETGSAEADDAELIAFTQKLQNNRRLMEGLHRQFKLPPDEIREWIGQYVTTQWTADNLRGRHNKDLITHCQSWIKIQLDIKQDREQRQRPRSQSNGHSPTGNGHGFANSAAKRTAIITPGTFSRRRETQRNPDPDGDGGTIRVDVEQN